MIVGELNYECAATQLFGGLSQKDYFRLLGAALSIASWQNFRDRKVSTDLVFQIDVMGSILIRLIIVLVLLKAPLM